MTSGSPVRSGSMSWGNRDTSRVTIVCVKAGIALRKMSVNNTTSAKTAMLMAMMPYTLKRVSAA